MRIALITVLTLACLCAPASIAQEKPELISVSKIWDAAHHNAFTSIVRFKDKWYVSFREGANHVGTDGGSRIIASADGEKWESVKLFTEEGVDLRDPKLCVTPDNRLMVVMGGSVYKGKDLVGRQPRVSFSSNGTDWDPLTPVLSDGHWLWRVTWHKGKAYGVSYSATLAGQKEGEWGLYLFESEDGKDFKLVRQLDVPNRPNETTLRFADDDTMIALVRREAGTKHAWIGTSKPPYKEWKWNETGWQVGGPDFIILPDGAMWAGGRQYTGSSLKPPCTTLYKMTLDSLTPMLELPSGGDTSYPGFVWHKGVLWMSYYASHEGKTSIYLAKIKLP